MASSHKLREDGDKSGAARTNARQPNDQSAERKGARQKRKLHVAPRKEKEKGDLSANGPLYKYQLPQQKAASQKTSPERPPRSISIRPRAKKKGSQEHKTSASPWSRKKKR